MSNHRDALAPYRRKRDPERTSEPFGGPVATRPPGGTARFVVQLHRARRLHYDFRLEHAGVLKSWAVPKGPSLDPAQRRLAVAVEDHPIEYGDFEGLIPSGNYGAGAVIVWDRGLARLKKDAGEGLQHGHLEFALEGYKLRGGFALVRTRGPERSWLLIKKDDAAARREDVAAVSPRSVLSGRTVDELADGRSRLDGVVEELAARRVPRRRIPAAERRPMLATPTAAPFAEPGWIYEIKYDGVRALAEKIGERVRLISRNGRDLTARFPELIPCLRSLVAERCLIDGELVAADARGRVTLAGLQDRLHVGNPRDIARRAQAVPAELLAFDCLELEGFDCRGMPLVERKALLQRLVPPVGPVAYVEHLEGDGAAIYDAAATAGLEGIVAKRAESTYVPRRSPSWRKVKCDRRDDFVIGGFTAPRGARKGLGALLVGQYDGRGLVYAGRVGSGFSDEMLVTLEATLASLATEDCPFVKPPARTRARWVRPELVCEVRFSEWTPAEQLRHPRLVRVRDDKRAQDCRRSEANDRPMERPRRPRTKQEVPSSAGPVGPPDVGDIPLTNVDKVFWPGAGYTKGDLIAYYRRIAPLMLPYLRDRPLTLTRYPDGIDGKFFYQQDAPSWVPGWIDRVRVYSKDGGREIEHFICNTVQALLYLANLGCIPLHIWSARLESIERPDWVIFDLDPGEARFTAVMTVARGLHRLLRAIGLRAYVKTSGSTGLHVLVPLGARYSHAEAKQFAELIARVGAEQLPDLATVERRPSQRAGKVYIDYGQNGHGRTIAAPYAVRARPGAPASAPLRWAQVRAGLDPAAFTIRTLPRRIRSRSQDPFRGVLGPGCDIAAALERLERRFL